MSPSVSRVIGSAERLQYRVGHGGFHATIVSGSGSQLTYVYDVGAHPSKTLLRAAITAFVGDVVVIHGRLHRRAGPPRAFPARIAALRGLADAANEPCAGEDPWFDDNRALFATNLSALACQPREVSG